MKFKYKIKSKKLRDVKKLGEQVSRVTDYLAIKHELDGVMTLHIADGFSCGYAVLTVEFKR